MYYTIAAYKPYILAGSVLSTLAVGTYVIYNKLKNPVVDFQTTNCVKDEQGQVTRRTTSEFSGKIRSKIYSTSKYSLGSVLITGYIFYTNIFEPNRWETWDSEFAPMSMDAWALLDFALVLLAGNQKYQKDTFINSKHVLWVLSNVNVGMMLGFWNVYDNDVDNYFKILLYPLSCFHGVLATLGMAGMTITCDKMIKDKFVELSVVSGLFNGLLMSHAFFHKMDNDNNVPNKQFYVSALMAFYVYFYSKKVMLVDANKTYIDTDEEEFDPIYHQLFLILPMHLFAINQAFFTAEKLSNMLGLN